MTICAGLKKMRPSMIMWPSPASAPMNSAPTMTKRARPNPRRSATRCRKGRGQNDVPDQGAARDAPRLAAARKSITSTRSKLDAMPTNIGKKVV